MLRLILITFLFLLFLYVDSFGQKEPIFSTSFFKEEKTLTYGLNNRRTSILNQNGTIYGLYAGISFGERVQHVVSLNSTIFSIGDDDYFGRVKQARLNFIGLSEEYFFIQKQFYGVCTYFQVGFGISNYRTNPALQEQGTREFILPTEWGLHQEFIIKKFIHLKSGVGYRWVVDKNEVPLNGWYYKVGLTINPKKALAIFKGN